MLTNAKQFHVGEMCVQINRYILSILDNVALYLLARDNRTWSSRDVSTSVPCPAH